MLLAALESRNKRDRKKNKKRFKPLMNTYLYSEAMASTNKETTVLTSLEKSEETKPSREMQQRRP